jgi:hypothetical protein
MAEFDPYHILEKRKKYRKTPKEAERIVKYNNSEKGKELSKNYHNSVRGKMLGKQKNLKRKYGLTLEEYYTKLKAQNHKCAICGVDEVDLERSLCVDHDHNTNVIRDLLCHACNLGIGMFKENKDYLKKAIAYLNKHKG